MKPISNNNLSAWGYVGLLILFSLPYVGTPALLICAIFVKDTAVRNFARALLILSLIGVIIIVVATVLGLLNIGDFGFEMDGTEVFRAISGLLG